MVSGVEALGVEGSGYNRRPRFECLVRAAVQELEWSHYDRETPLFTISPYHGN